MTPNNTKLVERLYAQLDADDPMYTVGVTGQRSRDIAYLLGQSAEVIQELVEALDGMLPHVFTGPRNDARDIAHWESERELGNGEAPYVLAAYAALERARA